MAIANQEAHRFNHNYIGTEHILLGLVREGSGVGANVLKNLGVDLFDLPLEVEKLIKRGPAVVTLGKLAQTPRSKRVIELAILESRSMNHNYVGTEHILLGLFGEGEGIAAQVLINLGLDLHVLRAEVLKAVAPEDDPVRATEAKERTGARLHSDESRIYRLGMLSVWMDDPKDTVSPLLASMGVDLEELRRRLANKIAESRPGI